MRPPQPLSSVHHVPVLPAAVLRLLNPLPGQTFVDCTVGAGGHTRLLAERVGPAGRVIGLDQDAAMLDLARPRLAGLPVTLIHASFDQLRSVLDSLNMAAVDGVLADLGLSSDQLDDPKRGFSFQQDGVLDMRMDPTVGESAADLLRRLNERDLADLIYQFGEDRHSRRIARQIVEARERGEPPRTTGELAELVRRGRPRPKSRHGSGIDQATRTFQALRIVVNDELGALERLLAALPGCVKPGGRAAVISFHSLEDRRVKQSFRDPAVWEVLTRKPVQTGRDEERDNPRSRSAKLRAAVRYQSPPVATGGLSTGGLQDRRVPG